MVGAGGSKRRELAVPLRFFVTVDIDQPDGIIGGIAGRSSAWASYGRRPPTFPLVAEARTSSRDWTPARPSPPFFFPLSAGDGEGGFLGFLFFSFGQNRADCPMGTYRLPLFLRPTSDP